MTACAPKLCFEKNYSNNSSALSALEFSFISV